MNRPCLLIIFAILLGASLMIRPVHAMVDVDKKEFVSCNILENDADFLLNVTDCSSDLKLDLTFNPISTKNTLTGWFNITDESNKTVFSQQFMIKKSVTPKIPITLNVKNLTSKMILKWGLGTSTVSVTQNTVYRVTGNDRTYSVDFQKSSCSLKDTCGAESNMTIFNKIIGDSDTYNNRIISGNPTASGLDYANSTLIESGNVRITLYFENQTGNLNASNTGYNWTEFIFAYPTYYQVLYTFKANNTFSLGSSNAPFAIYQAVINNTNNPNFDEWNNRTINGTNYLFSIDVNSGADIYPLGLSNSTIQFLYDDTDHNKSILQYRTSSNFTNNINNQIVQATDEVVRFGYLEWPNNESAGVYTLGYGLMFGTNGRVTVANNGTVWNLDFNEQYQAWYNPATMTAITGTQKGRNNMTGSYNYSANGTLADFNFSTVVRMNYTYPVFEVENLSSISNIVSHVWWKNYTNSSDWSQLTNYSDYVIQEGNSSFYGYNYIVLLLNKTLGRETANSETYELWISNTTDPSVAGETSPFTRTFNVPSKGMLNQQKGIILTKSFNVPSIEKNNFIRNPVVQRIFNILSEPTDNFFKGLGFIRITNVQSKEYVQINRNIILERTFNAVEKTNNTFSALLQQGLQMLERFLNIGTKAADSFFYMITGMRFMNVQTKDANQFNKIIILTKLFNVPSIEKNNFLRNPVVQKFFNMNQRESVGFSRAEIVSRLLSIRERMNVSFINQLPYNIFERLLSIPLDLIGRFIVYVRVWEQPSIYQVCSILQQIGDSRAYLCVYDTGEWKILIKGL